MLIKKILLVFLVCLLLLISFFTYKYVLRFLPFISHDKITIALPFAPEDDNLVFINPMGETVMHPNSEQGHPGLDLGWKHPAPLRASATGKVTRIKLHEGGGHGETEPMYDVEIVTGVYAIRYEEIAPATHLKVGTQVNQGDVIGRGGEYSQPGGLGTYYSTHWEFDYDTFWVDRLCPLTYFDADSHSRINSIWSKVGQTYDGRFPLICSGHYFGKEK